MPRSESRRAPPDPVPVTRVYLRDVGRTLLRENLRRTPTQRVQNLMALQALYEEARRAGRDLRRDDGQAETARPAPRIESNS